MPLHKPSPIVEATSHLGLHIGPKRPVGQRGTRKRNPRFPIACHIHLTQGQVHTVDKMCKNLEEQLGTEIFAYEIEGY